MSGTPSASSTASSPVPTLCACVTSIRTEWAVPAGVADFAREGLEPLEAPRRERHGGAVRGEGASEVPAEAAGCPGHERGAAAQVEAQPSCHGESVTPRRPPSHFPGDEDGPEGLESGAPDSTTLGDKWFSSANFAPDVDAAGRPVIADRLRGI